MATITTGDWQRIGYWQIYQTSYNTMYVSLNARVVSQDVTNNRTTVATLLNIDVIGSGSYTTDSVKAGLTGGADISWGRTTITNGRTLIQGSYTVNHNSDGTASTTIGCWVTQTYGGSLGWGEATVTLPTIPRASQPSINTWPGNSPNITAGVACTIHMNRASSSFTHKVTYSIGSASGTIASSGVTDNVGWTPPTSLCSQFPNATSKSGTITVTTYSGSTTIGSKSCTFNLSVPSYSPSITNMAVAENNSVVSAKSSSVTVQSLSNKTVSAKVNTSYSATISKVIIEGTTYTSGWSSGASVSRSGITGKTNGTYTISITDSRGKTASATVKQTYHSYASPTVTATGARNSSTVTTGTISYTAKYTNILSNSVTVSVKRGSDTAKSKSGGSSGSYSASESWTDLVATNSYSFVITVTDKFNKSNSITVNIGMSSIPLWIGKTNILMGKNSKVQDNQNVARTLVDMFYPVGSYYETSNTSFNPNTTWGGTWVEDSKDRVLIGGGSSYGYGSTGGSASHTHTTSGHTLTVNEMPSHTHNTGAWTPHDVGSWGARAGAQYTSESNPYSNTAFDMNKTGGSGSHSHGNTGSATCIQPYVSVKRWHRTA